MKIKLKITVDDFFDVIDSVYIKLEQNSTEIDCSSKNYQLICYDSNKVIKAEISNRMKKWRS